MKLEMEGREPLIVLFGLPIITTAIVLGSMYLGRMQAEAIAVPPVYPEPNITVTSRVTAEMPQGAIRNEIQVPPMQVHEVIKEVVKVPTVNVVNKVEPTPVQVNLPKTEAAAAELRFVVIPVPLPIPIMAAPQATSAATTSRQQTAPSTHAPEVVQAPPAPPLPATAAPPGPVQPTSVSVEPAAAPLETEAEGKLLPPPRSVGGQPKPQ